MTERCIAGTYTRGVVFGQSPSRSISLIDPVVDTGNITALGHSKGDLIGEGLVVQLGICLTGGAAVDRLGDVQLRRLMVGTGQRAAARSGNKVGFAANRIGLRAAGCRVVVIHQNQVRQRPVDHHGPDGLRGEFLRITFILGVIRGDLFQHILMSGLLDVQHPICQRGKAGGNLNRVGPFLFRCFQDISVILRGLKGTILLIVETVYKQIEIDLVRPVSWVDGVVPLFEDVHLIGDQRH